MSPLLQIGLWNAVIATGLALVVMVISRFVRRPALVHALWVLVLLKLLTPPLVPLAVLPVPAFVEAAVPSMPPGLSGAVPVGQVLPNESAVEPTPGAILWPHVVLRWLLPGLWLGGALVILVVAGHRGRRFTRILRRGRLAEVSVQGAAAVLAARLGLRRRPEVVVVEGRCSPMLWWRGRRLSLVMPEGLLAQLSAAELDSLLAHELTHVRRGDHWIRGLELLATATFWWHPVLWWARRALHRAEEQSCDAQAVQALSGRPRTYAGALLKTVTFLSGSDGRLPALASGIGEVRQLEERLTMIMKHRPTPRLSMLTRLALTLTAVAVLLTFPTWADRADADRDDARKVRAVDLQLTDLEREAMELERQLEEVRARQREIKQKRHQEEVQVQMERLEVQAVQLEATGRAAEATEVRRQREAIERRISLELERQQATLERQRAMEELEVPLRLTLLEIQELEASGDQAGADALRAEAQELKFSLQQAEQREMERRLDLERELHALELDRVRAAIDAAYVAGDEEAARKMEHKLEYLEQRGDGAAAEFHLAREKKIRQELEKLHVAYRELDLVGRDEEAAELQMKIKKLQAALEADNRR